MLDFAVALLTESVDWNCYLSRVATAFDCRSPHGERGLKCGWSDEQVTNNESLSSRRAWIEMWIIALFLSRCSVALLTESVDWNLGIPLPQPCRYRVALLTESVDWNRWLSKIGQFDAVALLTESVDWNINRCSQRTIFIKSLSSRRAWIEMMSISYDFCFSKVALLTESVDWN